METQKTYHRGVLLWVDDSFIQEPFREELATWHRMFGMHSDQVYRLMDLQITINTDRISAQDTVEKLAKLEPEGVYTFCILDLNIPHNDISGVKPAIREGIKLAKYVQSKGLNFVFLSSTSSVSSELARHKLSGVPYYLKSRDGGKRLPVTLVSYILQNFRANINWVSLKEVFSLMKVEQSFSAGFRSMVGLNSLSSCFFPFFGAFRDYIERIENRPKLSSGNIIISRCPTFHSDEFIQQCLAVATNPVVRESPHQVTLRYARTSNPHWPELISTATDIKIVGLRIDTFNDATGQVEIPHTTPEEFLRIVHEMSREDQITFLILPNDDSSDAYLERAFSFGNLLYEDLPTVRIGDSVSRELLIRNSIKLIFQNQVIRLEEETRLGAVYLRFPEIMVHPVSWILLLEADEVAEKLSDPLEILSEIEESISKLVNRASAGEKLGLAKGATMEVPELLSIGMETLKEDPNYPFEELLSAKWAPRALKLWLEKSWQFPYGLDKQVGRQEYRKKVRDPEEWEKFSFSVLQELVKLYHPTGSEPALRDAHRFMTHPTIQKMLSIEKKTLTTKDWTNLLVQKWPHRYYPMPAYLSSELKKEGRYFWLESDKLGLSQSLPSTQRKYRSFEQELIRIHNRLDALNRQLKYLPIEWKQYIRRFTSWINHAKLEDTWRNQTDEVYYSLLDFMYNALPISYMAIAIWSGKFQNNLGKFVETMKGISGAGTIIGMISGYRFESLFHFVCPSNIKEDKELEESLLDYTDHWAESLEIRLESIIIDNFQQTNTLNRIYDALSDSAKKEFIRILKIPAYDKDKYQKYLKALNKEDRSVLVDFVKKPDTWKMILERIPSLRFTENRWTIAAHFLDWFHKAENKPKDRLKFLIMLKEAQQFLGPLKTVDSNNKNGRDNISLPVDALADTLGLVEHFQEAFSRAHELDGFHFLNKVRFLRNMGKEVRPSTQSRKNLLHSIQQIRSIFESFCFGAEGLIAQLKFLLEMIGEEEKASAIPLFFVKKIELPKGVNPIPKAELKELLEVEENGDTGYHVFHLGVPGTDTKGKKTVRLDRTNKFPQSANTMISL